LIETLNPIDLAMVRKEKFFEPRVSEMVRVVMARLRVLSEKPVTPDVVIVALPSEIRKLITIPSRHASAPKKPVVKKREGGLFALFDDTGAAPEDDEPVDHSVFHHALKAHAMQSGLPTQLVWESTLHGAANEDEATRAWNLWTGVYYKSGRVPWRIGALPRGTCFVGVKLYRDRREGNLRSCLAQAFSDQGEGLVLRSEPFQWDGTKSPHLTKEVARDLMQRVLEAYESHLKHLPSRVVVHKWQRYTEDERAGFDEGSQGRVQFVDLVAFSDRQIRFFRAGQEPPLRGTMISLAPGNCLLYTRGYVPYLSVYPGMRVPSPLEITEHFGASSLTQICQEILALTRLDWNTAAFAGKEPITTAFADDVGGILSELPKGVRPHPQYRFYM
jgi:hypothetical protein